jgi:hypothetical protein
MSPKITSDHLARAAVVYIRQSTMAQVISNLESQRRQYALADAAKAAGFAAVITIDNDLGRSGSGLSIRPGFQKLVAAVCEGQVGAVYCLEASRLARNGRDWHHLIDLCALAGALVIDLDGVYDPRHVNDRLLLAASCASRCRPATAGVRPDGSRSIPTNTSRRRSGLSCASSANSAVPAKCSCGPARPG